MSVSDVDTGRANSLAERYGATVVDADAIYDANVDVLAPCALGGVLTPDTVARLRARVVCGGANNQLLSDDLSWALADKGVLYAPDYVANAGGVYSATQDFADATKEQARAMVEGIGARMRDVFDRAEQDGILRTMPRRRWPMRSSRPSRTRVLVEGTAPTPFTADEIRRNCPPGRVMIVAAERPGESPILREIRFVGADAETATQRFTPVAADGTAIGDSEVHTSSWAELQAHASFPADRTTITPEVIDTPLGTLDCLRYEVQGDDAHDTFWFATTLPGMPVRFTRHEDGHLVMVTTVTENRRET